MNVKLVKTITVDEFDQFTEASAGYCKKCRAFTRKSGVKPTGEGYRCPVCHCETVLSAEEAYLLGEFKIKDL